MIDEILKILMEETHTESRYVGCGDEPAIIVFTRGDDRDQESFLKSIAERIEEAIKSNLEEHDDEKIFERADFDALCDAMRGVFDVSVSEEQIKKLIKMTPDWKESCPDILQKDEFADYVCANFTGFKVPRYGNTLEYKAFFWKEIEKNKQNFIDFINKES